MPDLVTFTLLDAGHFHILLNIHGLCYLGSLENFISFRSCFHTLSGGTRTVLSNSPHYGGKTSSSYTKLIFSEFEASHCGHWRHWALLPSSRVVLSQASGSFFPCTSYMCIQNPQLNTQGGSSAGVLSLGSSSLSVTCPANSSHFDFLDFWLCPLNLERLLGSSWVSHSSTTARKLSPGSQLGELQGSPPLLPASQMSLSFSAPCPVF